MAVELVCGALLSSSFQVALERLASREVLDYFRGRKLNQRLLKKLNIKLLSINAVLDDAEQRQIRNPRVKEWLVMVKDAVFEAEDLLDEIDTHVSQSNLKPKSRSISSKVRNMLVPSLSSFDKGIDSRMQQVLDNLEYLAKEKDILGLKETGVGSGSQVPQKLPSTSLLSESVIYGRDVDKEIIFNWLVPHTENDDNQLSVISIVGMGGMGKTTLAQHLYNDPRLLEEGKFDEKVWVCVSDEFGVLKLTGAILEAITGSPNDSTDLNMVQVKLKEKLKGKKFLLVLDDVWNEKRDQWEALQTPLSYGAKGSKILVTTRSMKVASTMRSTQTHQLQELQEEHSQRLFAKHAFQNENSQTDDEFKEIGTKIIKKCKGLPLALKTIGSLLYTKTSLTEWDSILTSEIWDLPEEDCNIIPALILSYHHLPSHLKRCFAYCSLFPKDYLFEKEDLILLWMAENFLQQGKSMIVVGEQYFNDLLSRSFFQQSTTPYGGMYFVMHDLLNDLAKYVSGDFCCRLDVEDAHNIPKMTRHFSFASQILNQHSKGFERLHDANRLRTFLPCSIGYYPYPSMYEMPDTLMHDLFSKLTLLRVLSFVSSDLIELPETVGNLKHLRYLNLTSTEIKKLPDSVCLLYNLQVLKLRFCEYLEEWPSNLHKLTNLCYLDFYGTKLRKMPKQFGKLKNLQVLSSFYVGKDNGFNIDKLGEFNNLHGNLQILELQNVVNPLDALAANMKSKIHLVALELEWSEDHEDSEKEREVFEKLQPSKQLKELSVRNYGGKQFPDWFWDNSLVSLTFVDCKYCTSLPPLGLLPTLKKLSFKGLSGIKVIGAEFYGYGSSSSSIIPFPSLETLEFEDMEGWEEWKCNAVKGAFPRLRELYIKKCPQLKGQLVEQLWGGGSCMEGSSLGTLKTTDGPTMNIPLNHCHNFLEKLHICGDSLRTFPLQSFPKLHELRLEGCSNLEMISQKEYSQASSLRELKIGNCPKFVSFPRGGLSAPQLERFELDGLENLKTLPECMHILLPSLIMLTIEDCPQVESFSDGGLPSNLQDLRLSKCSKHFITSLKWALAINSTCLRQLYIKEVDVESFPDEGLLPLSLTFLDISNCPNLKKLDYKGLRHLSSLTSLYIKEVNVESFPDEGLLPLSLTSLWINNCPNLKKLDYKGLRHLSSLTSLYIQEVDVESFPDEGLLPLSLTSLWISNCPNLKKLDNKGLRHLSSLTSLYIFYCPSLECLPEEGLPKSISTLQIYCGSSVLEQRCQKPNGEDWGKISHIQQIYIGS